MTETGSEDDGLLDLSEDDFFLAGSSSDEAEADDEWTDRSARYTMYTTSMASFQICLFIFLLLDISSSKSSLKSPKSRSFSFPNSHLPMDVNVGR